MVVPLSNVAVGGAAKVLSLSDACTGLVRRRLLDLGITPGANVRVERASAGRSAIAYRIRQTLIALRREQAEHILVQPAMAEVPGYRR